jgi:hypothetical protein
VLLGENFQIGPPRAHSLSILTGHHLGDLSDMVQIVCDPRRQQLAQRDDPKLRMNAFPPHVRGRKMEGLKVSDIPRAQLGEFRQEIPKGLASALLKLRRMIECVKRHGSTLLEDPPRPRHPICPFAVYQMADHVICAPGVGSIIRVGPLPGQTPRSAARIRGVFLRIGTPPARSKSIAPPHIFLTFYFFSCPPPGNRV